MRRCRILVLVPTSPATPDPQLAGLVEQGWRLSNEQRHSTMTRKDWVDIIVAMSAITGLIVLIGAMGEFVL